MSALRIEFSGQWWTADTERTFAVGREGDLAIDDNPYLHRTFLTFVWDRYWWITNAGSHLTATLSDDLGALSAWLAPGATVPLLCRTTQVRFTAGPTTYLIQALVDEPAITVSPHIAATAGETTQRPVALTHLQRLVVLALSEEALRSSSSTLITVPSSQLASRRLGWPITRFNRQLDSVCQKLARCGVRGLHGDTASLASSRRSRLVEYALAVRLVSAADLPLLDQPTS